MGILLQLLCLVCLAALIIGVVLVLQRRRPGATMGHAPGSGAPELAHFVVFDRLLARWAAEGRLSADAAAQVRELLSEHVAATFGPTRAAPRAAEVPAIPAAPSQPAAPPQSQARAPQPAPEPAPAPPPTGPRRSRLASLGAALLALDTRRVLLFLGTFLLLMSSLTLVVFNWASLPPLLQFTILAGTATALWGAGTWMARRPELAVAGRNLQAVGALLMPVVGFALGRPGLLDLAPRPAWQLASALSLAAYVLAAWRTRYALYSGAAAVAALSLLLASLGSLATGWLPVAALLLLGALLPLARWLRRAALGLSAGPRWVALAGGPLAGAVALALDTAGLASATQFAGSLAAAALYCGQAYWLEARRPWLWATLLLIPLAAERALLTAGVGQSGQTLALAALAMGYFGLSEVAATRHRPAAPPLLAIALMLATMTLPATATSPEAARLALPPLILLGASAFTLVERGRLGWTGGLRPALATGGLAAAATLLFGWLAALLTLTPLSMGARGLALMVVPTLALAAAHWWPGRLGRHYDLALQVVGSGTLAIAAFMSLTSGSTRLEGAILLTLILGAQAVLRRGWPWATLSLGAGIGAAAMAIERFVPPTDWLRTTTLAALAISAAYSLAGAQLRAGGLRFWSWPAVSWGALGGAAAAGLAVTQIGAAPGVAAGTFLALAALLGVHTAHWRRPELGVGAAPLLALATLVAATRGFFSGWQPAPGDLAYVLCALALGLALIGRGLRRFGTAYGRPYELLAFILLPCAPLIAIAGGPAHLTLTWAAVAALYGLALWRYRLPWLLALAFAGLDLALLHGASWRWPGADPAHSGLLIAAVVWLQALASARLRRAWAPWRETGTWGYLAAGIGGGGALVIAAGNPGIAAGVALILAGLLAVLAWVEVHEGFAWGSLALLALGLERAHAALGLPVEFSLLLGALEALAIYVLGWGVQRLAGQLRRMKPWHGPLEDGVAAAVVALPLLLLGWSLLEVPELFGATLLLLGLAVAVLGWRRGLPNCAAPALICWNLALVSEGPLLNPIAWVRAGAWFLLLLAWVQGFAGIWANRRHGGSLAVPVYSAAVLASALACWHAAANTGQLGGVLLGLAALAALLASVERREVPAWVGVGLGLAGGWLLQIHAGQAPGWAAAWLVLALVGLSLAGWAATLAGLSVWRRPTVLGATAAAGALTIVAVAAGGELAPLTFALANGGLLLATLAVRERKLTYAYGAGAAFVGSALSQLATWEVRELQWYVIPAGLYLLALAAGLRRFQGRRRTSQLVEAAAVMLLLGTSLGQALRPEGGLPYSLLLFGESLAVAGYGALGRLRVPFLGGLGFFVAGVVWMTVDAVRLANQWVLLGAIGLAMVLAYVVLERHQERLTRAGRFWAAQLRSWG